MQKNISDIQQYLRDNQLFTRFDLHKVGFFGSFARDEENANDIDILIEDDIAPEKVMELKSLLEASYRKKVDVVLKKFANPIIFHRAQKDLQYATRY
jgi:predicted nucleotidyltransferase